MWVERASTVCHLGRVVPGPGKGITDVRVVVRTDKNAFWVPRHTRHGLLVGTGKGTLAH